LVKSKITIIFVKHLKQQLMTIQEIKQTVPSVFATEPSPKMSNKYVFVPTFEILENFEREGWNLASGRQIGKGIYGLHELRFRNQELPKVGDSLIEAVIKNSHNGLATFSVSAGLHRLVCSNGLTVPTSLSESFNLRHKSFDLDEVKRLTESFASRLPVIQGSVNKMMEKELSEKEKMDFVKRATSVRWKVGSVPASLDLNKVLEPKREGDKGDSLWNVFNVVQEKFVRGGVNYNSNSGRKTGLKSLSNIIAVNQVNTKLWTLAEEML
jgi:hypothetical protein